MALEDTFKLGLLMKLIDEFSKPSTTLVNRMEAMRQSAERLKKTSETMTKVGAAVSLAGGALLGSLVIPTKIAADFRASMADLQAAAQFSPEQYNQFASAINNMSKRIPLGTKELIELAKTGKDLGVANKDLASFVESAAKLSLVLRTSPEAAGQVMGNLADIYSLPMEKVELLGDAVLRLASKVEVGSGDILTFLTNAGNAATNIGLTATQTAALGSALLKAGQTPEMATMALNDMFNTFKTLKEQPKDVQKAFREMGIPATTFSAVLKKYPMETMMAFLERAKKTGKESELFFRIFGERSAARLVKLITNLDVAKTALGEVADESSYAGETNKRFAERTKELNEQITLFWNRLKAVGKMIGDFVLPKVIALITRVASVTGRIGEFVEKHQKLARIITIVVGGLGLFLVVAGGLLTFFGTIGFLVSNAIIAFTAMPAILGVVGGAFALLVSPIGLALAAILLIVGAALLIRHYWEPIKAFFSDLWGKITADMQRTWETMKVGAAQAWTDLVTPISKAWTDMLAWLTRIQTTITDFFMRLDLTQAGMNLINSFINGIKNKANELYDSVSGVAQKIRNYFPFSPAKTGPLRDLHRMRLIETIAATLKADPLLLGLQSILSKAAALGTSIPIGLQPSFAGLPSPSIGPTAGAGTPGGGFMGRNIIVNIASGAIIISGTDIKNTKDLAEKVAKETGFEVDKMMRRKYKI